MLIRGERERQLRNGQHLFPLINLANWSYCTCTYYTLALNILQLSVATEMHKSVEIQIVLQFLLAYLQIYALIPTVYICYHRYIQ